MAPHNKTSPPTTGDIITRLVLTGVAVIGLGVIVGWHFRVRVLVQLFSGAIAMQYNTALCVLVLALSGYMLVTRRGHWLGPVFGGAFTAVMGALVIYQYASGHSIGIDTLFFYPWLNTLSANPGRMALTTAVGFVSSGLALILLSCCRTAVATFAILHTVPVSLGLTSAVGYLAGITFVLPFSLGSQMAVHTAFAFLGYGSAMLRHAWQQASYNDEGSPRWAPAIGILTVPILFVGISITAYRTSTLGWTLLLFVGLLSAGLFALATHSLTHSSIKRKGLILVSVPLVFLFVFVVLLAQLSRTSQQAEASFTQSKEIITTVETISTDLFEAESSIRGYVITGDPEFAKSFERPTRELPKALRRLQSLVQDSPGQKTRTLELTAKAEEKLALQASIQQLVRDGNRDQAIERVKTAIGLQIMNDFRRAKEAFLDEERRIDIDRRQAAETSLQAFNWLLVAGSSLDLFLAVILAILFSSGISKRIMALTGNAQALAKGEELAKPMKGADEIAQLDHVFHDMAEALQQAAKKERAIFENALDVICTVDAEGKFIRISPSSIRVWGYRPEELIGRRYKEFLVSEDVEKSEQAERDVLIGKALTDFENRYRTKDGRIVDMLWSAWWSETDQAIFATGRDITERKCAETALRESEERYRLLFESNPHPIWVYDSDSLAFLAANQAAILHYGYSREEFLAMSIKDIRPPEEVPALLESLSSVPSGQINAGTWKHRKKNGEIIEVEITSHQLTFAGRSAEIVLANDVTERKRAEKAINELNTNLEKRSAQLEQANKELEAFSYSVSHDLRAPLRAIDGFSRILLEDYSDKFDADGARIMDVIRSNTQNMGRLIDDLLAFSRLGRKAIERSPIDMTELARNVSQSSLASTRREPTFILEPLPPAYGDPALVRQVFVNLLSNAAKYSRTRDEIVIEVGGHSENGESLYYVKDNGVGFDMNYANKLFGVFQRLHSVEEFEGTGVGLAIVQRIIHRHGGRVWANGKVNGGATFYFTLPKEYETDGKLSKPE
jgi:PAS domain S-box-containing protein